MWNNKSARFLFAFETNSQCSLCITEWANMSFFCISFEYQTNGFEIHFITKHKSRNKCMKKNNNQLETEHSKGIEHK